MPYLQKDRTMLDQEDLLLNALVDPIPRDVFDALVKSADVCKVIAVLKEAHGSNEPLANLSMKRNLDTQTKSLMRRLHGSGLKHSDLPFIFRLADYLKRLQRYKKTQEITLSNRSNSQNSKGSLKLSSINVNHFKLNDPDHFNDLSSHVNSLINSRPSSLRANEDWQNMFDAELDKNSGKKDKKESSSDVDVSVANTKIDSGEIVVNKVVNRCTSECQTALNNLLMSKREELNSAIIMRCSDERGRIYRSTGKFRPKGHLIAHLHEHKKAVLKMTGIEGTSLFASCSQDGTVKLWDCNKTERTYPINRSKATYTKQKGVITSITSCSMNESIASCSDNGSIHVFKIEKQRSVATRQLDPKKDGFATDVNFMEYNSSPLLTYSTVFGKIIGWDLRAPREAWIIDSGVRKGVINSFTVDPMSKWLGVGTSSGYHVCWDLRFMLPISEILHPDGKESKRVTSHPKTNSFLFSSTSSCNEVILYDLESTSRVKTLWASPTPPLTLFKRNHTSFDELVIGLYAGQSDGSVFVLTGGTDCRLRYWDLDQPENSYTIAHSIQYNTEKYVSFFTSRVIDGSEVIVENNTSQLKGNPSEQHSPKRMDQPPTGHKDTISDIIVVDHPQRIVITSSYDGVIKMWK